MTCISSASRLFSPTLHSVPILDFLPASSDPISMADLGQHVIYSCMITTTMDICYVQSNNVMFLGQDVRCFKGPRILISLPPFKCRSSIQRISRSAPSSTRPFQPLPPQLRSTDLLQLAGMAMGLPTFFTVVSSFAKNINNFWFYQRS